jgi:K+-transporting ATPase KdpF subunit
MIALTDVDNWIGLGIAGLGVVYLFLVLIRPERF